MTMPQIMKTLNAENNFLRCSYLYTFTNSGGQMEKDFQDSSVKEKIMASLNQMGSLNQTL